MRLIDADALIKRLAHCVRQGMRATIAYMFMHMIDDAPTIDAVSVVRCKDCRWAKANGTYQWCGRLDSTARIKADDFCSYGEREGER